MVPAAKYPIWHFLVAVAALLTLSVFVIARPTDQDMATTRSETVPAAQDLAALVRVPTVGWTSWSLLSLSTGQRIGSPNSTTETNNTESMIKAWIATDYVAGVESEGRSLQEWEHTAISNMIRLSDNDAAEMLYLSRGGDDVISRLITECGLTNVEIASGLWAYTQITAADAVTMMACILQRVSASPLTTWVVSEMRQVSPEGMFGIPQALPAGSIPAVKNGWTLQGAENRWRLNCLASWGTTILAVLTWYPAELSQDYGAAVCRSVTEQLLLHGLE